MDDRTLYATILGVARRGRSRGSSSTMRRRRCTCGWRSRPGRRSRARSARPISPLHDHVERSWRHLDTCQYETRLHARVPRVRCADAWREDGARPVGGSRIRASRCCSSGSPSRG